MYSLRRPINVLIPALVLRMSFSEEASWRATSNWSSCHCSGGEKRWMLFSQKAYHFSCSCFWSHQSCTVWDLGFKCLMSSLCSWKYSLFKWNNQRCSFISEIHEIFKRWQLHVLRRALYNFFLSQVLCAFLFCERQTCDGCKASIHHKNAGLFIWVSTRDTHHESHWHHVRPCSITSHRD